MKFSGNSFFFFFPGFSQLFKIKDKYGLRCSVESMFGSERMGS